MLQRALLISVTLFVCSSLFAASAKSVAPATVPHPIALFLAQMSDSGRQKVSFKAQAIGTYFFFEEATGVSIYTFDGNNYQKTEFMKGATLAKAMKKYSRK